MTSLVIDRSTPVQSLAFCEAGVVTATEVLEDLDCRSGAWVLRLRAFLAGKQPARLVVGVGPGSFAGIRAALAFAQGYAIGSGCEVWGLTSAAAFAEANRSVVVIGDARQGLFWVATFAGYQLVEELALVQGDALLAKVPAQAKVVSPDDQRIGAFLRETFGARYAGEALPSAARLAEAAQQNPALLKAQPLPIYLNPAVRNAKIML